MQPLSGRDLLADLHLNGEDRRMHSTTGFERRKTLSLNELERLRSALVGEVENYRLGIRGYSPEKMARHGAPYLAKLEARVAEVDAEIARRV